MDYIKQIEILRKRNSFLQEQLDKSLTEANKYKELLKELENIKDKWNKELENISKQKSEYARLIDDMQEIRNTLKAG